MVTDYGSTADPSGEAPRPPARRQVGSVLGAAYFTWAMATGLSALARRALLLAPPVLWLGDESATKRR